MQRILTICWVVSSLSFISLTASSSQAQLRCVSDTGPGTFAACTTDVDCVAVGGTACTQGICLCEVGSPIAPFCPCEVNRAPTVSSDGLIALAAILGASGVFALWRGTRRKTQLAA